MQICFDRKRYLKRSNRNGNLKKYIYSFQYTFYKDHQRKDLKKK